MAIFFTGSTGYLASHLVAGLLNVLRDKLNLLIPAKTEQEARERLWTSLQLHFEFPEFFNYLNTRVRIFRGDLTADRFGLSDDEYHALVDTTDSLIHCAAIRTFPRLPSRENEKTKSSPKMRRSTGRAPITIPTRAPKNSANIWRISFCLTCPGRFSARPSLWATAAVLRLRNSIWCKPFTFWRRCLFFRSALTI